jgi:hypothetical protein
LEEEKNKTFQLLLLLLHILNACLFFGRKKKGKREIQ